MDPKAVFEKLRSLNEPVPKPRSLPTEEEVRKTEEALGIRFPESFKDYLLNVSDVVYGYLEPVTINLPGSHTDFAMIYGDYKMIAQQREESPALFPICEDNDQYYCMDTHGQIVLYPGYGGPEELWPTLEDWIDQVWLSV